MTDIPNFPTVDATDRADGSIEVQVLGVSNIFEGADARGDALRYMHSIATRDDLNRPIRVHTHFDDVDATLIIEPEGHYYDEQQPAARFPIPPQTAVDQEVAHANAVAATARPAAPGPIAVPGAGLLGDPINDTPTAPPPPPAAATPVSAAASEAPQPRTSMVAGPGEPRHHQRRSFIDVSTTVEPARQGWRGAANRLGLRLGPGPLERDWRDDAAAAEQHWPGPRTIAITNPKGGAAKTSTTVLLSALFARYGGAGVLAWDNNETRGTLAWRTEQGAHEATVLDLLPRVSDLLSTSAQSAEMSYFAHHQRKDKYDVLQSDQSVEGDHEVSADDVDAIHRVASRYYRMIVMDSGNSERAANWRAMIDRSNALVVPCTNRADTAENGALMLEALRGRDEHARQLAENAVVIVSNATGKKADDRIKAIAEGFRPLVRDVVTIPYDPALVEGVIHYDALRPATQRAWLRAAAAVARGL